jgi:hypothetical protein
VSAIAAAKSVVTGDDADIFSSMSRLAVLDEAPAINDVRHLSNLHDDSHLSCQEAQMPRQPRDGG